MNSSLRAALCGSSVFPRPRIRNLAGTLALFCLVLCSTNALSIATPVPVWRIAQRTASVYGSPSLRGTAFLSDGSLLVAVVELPVLTMTRIDAAGTILSRFRATVPSVIAVANIVATPAGEVYVAGTFNQYTSAGSVVSKWDGLTGQNLWNAVSVDEIGSSEALGTDVSGNLVIAGVSRWGAGMVFARLDRFTGAFLTAPTLLPSAYQSFLGMSLDPDGNLILAGGATSSGSVVVGKVSTTSGLEIWGPVTVSSTGGPAVESVRCTASGDVVVGTRTYYQLTLTKLAGASGAVIWADTFSSSYQLCATALDGAGDVYAAFATGGGSALATRLDGATGTSLWSAPLPTDYNLAGFALSVDGEGAPTIVSWTSYVPGTKAVRLAHADGSTRWGPVTLTPLQSPSVVITPAGDAVVLGTSASGLVATELAATSGGVNWGPFLLDTVVPTATSWSAVQVDGAGDVILAGQGYSSPTANVWITKVSGVSGGNLWGPISLPSQSYYSGTPLLALAGSGGDVFFGNLSDSGGNPTLRRLSGSDGSTLWGPIPLAGALVAMAVDGAGDLVVLRRDPDAQNHARFAVEKRSAATGALVWGPAFWHSDVQLDDIPTALRIDGAGNVVVAGTSKIALNGGVRGVVLSYSGTTGALVWGPLAFDDFGQGVSTVLVDRSAGSSLFVTTIFGYGSWNGYPVIVRRLDAATGASIWGPITPVLPTPYNYANPRWTQGADPVGDLFVGLTASANIVAKLRSSDGSVAWSTTVSTYSSWPSISSVAIDPDGNSAVIANGNLLVRSSGVDGSDLWSDLPTGSTGVSGAASLALNGRDVILVGGDRGGPAAARITGGFTISPPADGALAAACGQPFALGLATSNGRAPYLWSVVSGALPPGVTLSGGGTISGTATVPGLFSFRVQVTDADGKTAVRDLVMEVVDASPFVAIQATPGALCQGISTTLSVAGSWTSYLWSPGGQTTSTISITPSQPQTIGVTVSDGSTCLRHGTLTIQPRPGTPQPVVSAPLAAASGATGLVASVPFLGGVSYAWTITGGSITGGQGTNQITFTAGAVGTLRLQVVETPAGGCPSPAGSASIVVGTAAQTSLYTLTPCRVLDTRGAVGPWGGPSLAPGAARILTVAGRCGIPADAKAVAANVTVVAPGANGGLHLWPGDLAMPTAPALPLNAGRVRAVAATLGLATDGTGTIALMDESAGPVDVLLDVSGYFR